MNKEAVGTLTGKYFHSVKSDRETIEWQGQFLGLASPGLYRDRKSTRLNSSHLVISYAVFCLKKKNEIHKRSGDRPDAPRPGGCDLVRIAAGQLGIPKHCSVM